MRPLIMQSFKIEILSTNEATGSTLSLKSMVALISMNIFYGHRLVPPFQAILIFCQSAWIAKPATNPPKSKHTLHTHKWDLIRGFVTKAHLLRRKSAYFEYNEIDLEHEIMYWQFTKIPCLKNKLLFLKSSLCIEYLEYLERVYVNGQEYCLHIFFKTLCKHNDKCFLVQIKVQFFLPPFSGILKNVDDIPCYSMLFLKIFLWKRGL